MREAPYIVPHEVQCGLDAVERGPLSPAKRPELRVGSAVAQRGLFHAEGSFELGPFKNGLHISPISNDLARVGPQVYPDFRSSQFGEVLSGQSAQRDT